MTHEEALTRIKTWHLDVDTMEVLSTLIPELKESRDEKIRKAIKLLVEMKVEDSIGLEPVYGASYKEMIAWLEKQKEQKTKVIIPKFRIGDVIIKSTKAKWEKPVRIVSIEKDGYSIIPIDTYGGGFMGFAFEEEYELYKQEWSEEDETKLRTAQTFIRNTSLIEVEGIKEATIDWLKSLKDRMTWRPTEEQMTALRRMKAAIAGEGEIYGPLNSLYEDLNKLLEE